MALLFGAVITGQNLAIAPDYSEAKASAQNVFALITREPAIDSESDKGISPVRWIVYFKLIGFVTSLFSCV